MTRLNYPLLFRPAYKDYIWGGDRLSRKYGRVIHSGVCAESWEISDRPEGMSVVANGPLAGRSLASLVKDFGSGLIGGSCGSDRFPLLMKIIDAREQLSVQIHPADENAGAVNGEAKTEMWYVLDAEAGAVVLAGLKKTVSKRIFTAAAGSRKMAPLLRRVKVRAGDAILVPGGTVHAIGEGLLIFEVQQNSNTTFRLYDWDRTGPDGKQRPLHISEAVRTVLWPGKRPAKARQRVTVRDGRITVRNVLACPYFRVERIDLGGPFECCNDGRSFHAFFVTEGAVGIRAGRRLVSAGAGMSCLVPASIGRYTLSPATAKAAVLKITLG
ncbi:MAG: type I phosphomannose isomerase catalytic subunit [bacterium]